MQAGDHGDLLLRAALELCGELSGGEVPGLAFPKSTLRESGAMAGMLAPGDEALVGDLRNVLARIATALGATPDEGPRARAIGAALDGAEMVMLGELLNNNAGRLPELLPSLVFLVALPIVEQDRALELSRRTRELIAKAFGTA